MHGLSRFNRDEPRIHVCKLRSLVNLQRLTPVIILIMFLFVLDYTTVSTTHLHRSHYLGCPRFEYKVRTKLGVKCEFSCNLVESTYR